MDRAMYPSSRHPSFGSRRSSSHISRRDLASDFNNNNSSNNNNNNHNHRTLTVRSRYPDRNKTSASLDDYGCDLRGSFVYCPTPLQQRPRALHQSSIPASCALDPSFISSFDEIPRASRATEVYEVPTTLSYAAAAAATASEFDGSLRSTKSSQTSRPSSRESSNLVYAEYEDEEEKERKRFLGTELYGYVMAMRLKERLVEARQVLGLYRDFDRVSESIFVIETQKDFLEIIRQAIDATREVEKPLRKWAESGKGKTERAYYTHKLLETASEVVRLWQKRFEWIRTRSDELLYVHGTKGSDKRQTYTTRREKCMASVEEALMLLRPREMEESMEGVQELGEKLRLDWRRDGRLTADEMIRRKGLRWGTIAGRVL